MGTFSNYLYVTTDTGKSWKHIADVGPICRDIQLLSDSLWYFNIFHSLSPSSSFCKSTDQLQTYTVINDSFIPEKFHFTDSLHGVTGGLYTNDGGITWLANGTLNYGLDYSFIDSINGWTFGSNSVSRTSDGGVTWINLASGIINSGSSYDRQRIQFPDLLHGFLTKKENYI